MLPAFLAALGTDMLFTPVTIDQPNKVVSKDRMGSWAPTLHDLDHSEVILLLGTNPLISHQALGVLMADPTRTLKAAKARGLKLISVDPRLTETARHADLHLQPIPGQDPAILAGLIRLILTEGWEDKAFCEQYVGADRMAALRDAVVAFTPEMVQRRAGLAAGQIASAAAMFARDHKAGAAVMTTGGSFAPFANLTQHLLDLLNIICGRLKRAGDKVVVDMHTPPGAIHAEVTPPKRPWDSASPSRIRGAGTFANQKLTATLAEEILEPGEGQIRCLIMVGGNPASVVPDRPRMIQALNSLDLAVTLDPCLTDSAELSHYVIAPKMMFERPDLSFSAPGHDLQSVTHAQYTPAIISSPAGADVIDDWFFLWSIAERLKLQICYAGTPLDMKTPPTTNELLARQSAGARISLEELKVYPSGRQFDHPDCVVAAGRTNTRFDVIPDDVAKELEDFLAIESTPGRFQDHGRIFRFLLSSRRSRHIYNSTLNQLGEVRKRIPFNPVFIHPADLTDLDLDAGDVVEVESHYGCILAVVQADESMRRDVVSMIHCTPTAANGIDAGRTSVNSLIDVRRDYDSITAMPRMSAIPVNIRRSTEVEIAGSLCRAVTNPVREIVAPD
jgi:anaerobic selenocysteine-containing dehydrogenase